MTDDVTPPLRRPPSRLLWALDAGVAAGALTTGALLAFGRARAGLTEGFRRVGEVVAGTGTLSAPLEVAVGLLVHWGQMIALGAAMALLLGGTRIASRLRAALLVVLAWELWGRVAWMAVLRVDLVSGLATAPRIGLAVVVVVALALAPRRR